MSVTTSTVRRNVALKSASRLGIAFRLSWQRFALAGILVGAIGLRLAGLDSGLPLVFNSDEVTVVEHSLGLSWNDLNPHIFMYGSFPLYFLKFTMTAAGFTASIFKGATLTLPDYYLLSRFISAALGTATVYLVFLFGKLLANSEVGLLSAGIFGISPLAVGISYYATADSMLGFWSALSLVGMIAWLKGNQRGMYLAGIAAGLAIATKYNAAAFFVPVFLIAMQLERVNPAQSLSRARKLAFGGFVLLGSIMFVGVLIGRDAILNLVTRWTTRGELQPVYVEIFDRMLFVYLVAVVLGLGLVLGMLKNARWANRVIQLVTGGLFKPVFLAALIFVIASPFVLLDLPAFTRDFFFQVNKNISGGIVGYFPGSRSYLAIANESSPPFNPLQYVEAIQEEWGILVFAAIFFGILTLWRQDRSAFIPFGSLILLMLVGTATWRYQATRYLFPLWTLFAVFGGLGIASIVRILSSQFRNLWLGRAILGGFVMIALQMPLRSSVDLVRYGFLMPDTRNLALEWIKGNLPSGTIILREWGTPEIERVSADYRVHYTGFPFEEATLDEWESRGVTIFIISAERYDFYRARADAFQDVLAEYDKLRERKLLQSFEPGGQIKGPPVYIYAIP